MGNMVFNSFFGNTKLMGNFFIGESFCPAQFKDDLPFFWQCFDNLVDRRLDFFKFEGILCLILFCNRTKVHFIPKRLVLKVCPDQVQDFILCDGKNVGVKSLRVVDFLPVKPNLDKNSKKIADKKIKE